MQDRTAQWDVDQRTDNRDRPSPGHTFFKVLLVIIVAIILSILISWPVIRNFGKIQEFALRFKPKAEYQATAARIGPENLKTYQETLENDLTGIQKKMSVFLPKGPYLIINTSANNFRLLKEDETINIVSAFPYLRIKERGSV